MIARDVRELKKTKEEREKSARRAVFFDLDGTLTPLPSLEQRFVRTLRYRHEIPLRNYFLWLHETMRLLPRGINAVTQGNKMYLKGVQVFGERDAGDRGDFPSHMRPAPRFFEDALEHAAWHASQGHAIVIVSGTLEPLANAAARKLEAELVACGFAAKIQVCATRLDEAGNKWTGRILGEAMFGKAKARAIKELAQQLCLDLPRSYAYGDSANDRWLLASVGNPAAVNPSRKLTRIAKKRGWPVLHWDGRKELPQRIQSSQRAQRELGVTADPLGSASEPSPDGRARVEFCLSDTSVINSGSRS